MHKSMLETSENETNVRDMQTGFTTDITSVQGYAEAEKGGVAHARHRTQHVLLSSNTPMSRQRSHDLQDYSRWQRNEIHHLASRLARWSPVRDTEAAEHGHGKQIAVLKAERI